MRLQRQQTLFAASCLIMVGLVASFQGHAIPSFARGPRLPHDSRRGVSPLSGPRMGWLSRPGSRASNHGDELEYGAGRGGGALARLASKGAPKGGVAMKASSISMGYRKVVRMCNTLTNLFPLWVVLAVCAAFVYPASVTWLSGDLITLGVGATMVFTGMTLTVEDFAKILQRPSQVAMGFLCQYTVMPLTGYYITKLMRLTPDIAAGVILVSCCPGGTSSNLITLIAKGDVALSVLMTTASTGVAAVVTPTLVKVLAGSLVELDAWGLVKSTLQVVMGPVGLGLLINRYFPTVSRIAQTVTPVLSVWLVALICGSIIGQTSSAMLVAGPAVAIAVTILHSLGFVFGWGIPKLLGYSERVARTTSVETGIQSSALAVVLATRHFPNPIHSSLPGALSGTVQSILGSMMATAWHYSSIEESDDDLNALLDNIEDPSDMRMSNERLLQMWDEFDSDGNGSLDRAELARLLIACYKEQIQAIKTKSNLPMSKAIGARAATKISRLMKTTSYLGIKACEDQIWRLTYGTGSPEFDRIFERFDQTGDGKISKDEYMRGAPEIIKSTFVPAYEDLFDATA